MAALRKQGPFIDVLPLALLLRGRHHSLSAPRHQNPTANVKEEFAILSS